MTRFWHPLFLRKERWGLSWRGWLAALLLVVVAGWGVARNLYPFLALNHPVSTNVLVVEGWVHPFAIEDAVKEFKTGRYERVYTTGGPVEGTGDYSNDFNTEASVGADLLVNAGIPKAIVQMVPARAVERNRTYASAVALRNWFQEHNVRVRSFNVLTEDVHARRTWLLFQEAFGKDVQVGIIAAPDPDYNAKYWWKYSEGVREVLSEGIAYVYAKFFFWPGKDKS